MKIHIPASNKSYPQNIPLAINGRVRSVPVGVDTDQPADVLAALDGAGIAYRVNGGNGVKLGNILIRGTGSRVSASINGKVSYFDVNKDIPDTVATRKVLDAAGIPYIISSDLGAIPATRAKMDAVRAGTGRLRIAFAGNSTTAGVGSGGVLYSFSRYFRDALQAAGVPTRFDASYIAQPIGPYVADARWNTPVAGWADVNSLIVSNSSNANPLTFSPAGSVTNFDWWYYDQSNNAQATVQIDAGATAPINMANSLQFKKKTITAAAGVHSTTVKRVANEPYLAFVEGYNPAVADVSFLNLGVSGSTSEGWSNLQNEYSAINLALALACDVYFFDIFINDMVLNVPLATAKAQAQVTITALKAIADVVIVVPHPVQLGDDPGGVRQASFIAAARELAATNNLPIVDFYAMFGSYTAASDAGYVQGDNLHYAVPGSQKEGAEAYRVFSQLVGL